MVKRDGHTPQADPLRGIPKVNHQGVITPKVDHQGVITPLHKQAQAQMLSHYASAVAGSEAEPRHLSRCIRLATARDRQPSAGDRTVVFQLP